MFAKPVAENPLWVFNRANESVSSHVRHVHRVAFTASQPKLARPRRRNGDAIEARIGDFGIFDSSIFMLPLYPVEMALTGVGMGALMSAVHAIVQPGGEP